MDNNAAASAYKQNAIENAPPIKIVRMLYQGAIRFLDQACQQDPHDPKSKFNDLVHAADRIVSELRLALEFEMGEEVGENLERLYLFVESSLGQAMIKREIEPLRESRKILMTLLEAWNGVEIQADQVGSLAPTCSFSSSPRYGQACTRFSSASTLVRRMRVVSTRRSRAATRRSVRSAT